MQLWIVPKQLSYLNKWRNSKNQFPWSPRRHLITWLPRYIKQMFLGTDATEV